MSIRIKFFSYLVLSSILAILLAFSTYITITNGIHTIEVILLLIILVCYYVLFLFIRKDFLLPMLNLYKYSNRYKNQQNSVEDSGNVFHSITKIIDVLADESEGLYDDMSVILKKQIDRLAKKSSILGTLYNVSLSLNKINDIDKLLKYFLQLLTNMTDANSGVIRILNNNQELAVNLVTGNIDDNGQKLIITNSDCICFDITKNNNGVQFSVHTCKKCVGKSSQTKCKYGTIFIPLTHKTNNLGVVSLFFDKTPSLSQDERSLLQSIGYHLALAIEKDSIDKEAKRLSINQERLFLSQDIHDSLSQILYSLGMQTSVLLDIINNDSKKNASNKAQDIKLGVQQANAELRNLLRNFREPISNLGLVSDIKNLVNKFKKDNNINVFIHNEQNINISLENSEQILKIVQESLVNIGKHSNANNVRILISKQKLLIEDDGKGFDVRINKSHSGAYLGLNIIKERALRIGAKLTINSEINEGTQIVLDIPNVV